MGRLVLAFRVFFRVLFSALVADQVQRALSDQPAATPPPPAPRAPAEPKVAPAPVVKRPARSEALTFLAALQREARFVDFIKEPIDEYEDAQIGAAVRDVHRDCGKVLERVFKLRPILNAEEGTEVTAPAEPERSRLVGQVTGSAPFRGRLLHHGWEAAACDLPEWTGTDAAARVVAPAEIDVK